MLAQVTREDLAVAGWSRRCNACFKPAFAGMLYKSTLENPVVDLPSAGERGVDAGGPSGWRRGGGAGM